MRPSRTSAEIDARIGKTRAFYLYSVLLCVIVGATAIGSQRDLAQSEVVAGGSDSQRDLVMLYRERIQDATADELKQLVSGPDEGLAIAAAWERVRRTIPTEERHATVRADALQRFVGFLEGRLAIGLPEWWQRALLDARSFGRHNIIFSPHDHQEEILDYVRMESGLLVSADVLVEELDDGWLVTRGEFACTIPAAIMPEEMRGRGLAVHLDGERCYLASYDLKGSPFELYCVNATSGELLWSGQALAAGLFGGGTGQWWNWVEMEPRGSKIVLLGMTINAAYLEVFDAETGVTIYRFSTSYFQRK